jgi:hypothetical protein
LGYQSREGEVQVSLKSQQLVWVEEDKDLCGCQCTGSKGLNTLRAVESRAQEVCAEISEGVREVKLRRDSSVVNIVEQTLEKFRTGQSFKTEKISKEKNRRLGITMENCEVPQTVRSGRIIEGYNPRAQEIPIAITYRHIGVCISKSFELVEIVSSDFPIQWKPSIIIRTHGIRSREVRIRCLGFHCANKS